MPNFSFLNIGSLLKTSGVNFIADVTSGLVPTTVQFINTSTGEGIVSWLWNFGDSGTSTLKNPSHIYNISGNFTVTLTATFSDSSVATKTRTDYIVITGSSVTADFSFTPILGRAPFTAVFTDLSVGSIVAWYWNFGDGRFSTLQNPTHTYPRSGTYTVTLSAITLTGSDSISKTLTVRPSLFTVGGGTIILNSDLNCEGDVIVDAYGIVIPVASEVMDPVFSSPIQDYVASDGKAPAITSLLGNIDISGLVKGDNSGFGADLGPGANSTLLDNSGLTIPLYGATHAGIGAVTPLPGQIVPSPKPIYGDYEAPLSIGSGSGVTRGGSGLRLNSITGSVNIDGTISLSGQDSDTTFSGGASGGSLWVSARVIKGSGSVTAEGGDASTGGGGGGYITFDYDSSNIFDGSLSVLSRKDGNKGVIFIDEIEPVLIEKFTGTTLNSKWWEIIQTPATIDNLIQMDSSIGTIHDSIIQSKFSVSGKKLKVDIDFSCSGIEPTSYTSYLQLYKDDYNWFGITRKYNHTFGSYEISGFPSQTAMPYSFLPHRFRIDRNDSTFNFQIVDSSTGPQTIFSEVITDFDNSKFKIRVGTQRIIADASRRMEWFKLTSADILNESVTLSSVPLTNDVALNVLHGSAQYYGVDFTSYGQIIDWAGMGLSGYLQKNDYITIQYIPTIVDQALNTSFDNLRVYGGILHDVETTNPTVYVDQVYGSDSNNGLPLTPLQNLFVATSWAKRGGTVVLYDGTYNPTEILHKDLMILGANGASPLITTINSQDTTGSNWENSCVTFRDCQGMIKNIRMSHAKDAIYANNTQGLEIIDCTIEDATTGIRFEQYTHSPKILRNTIKGTEQAIVLNTQVYDPYIYSNVIYDASNAVVSTDSTNLIISSNTIDDVVTGIVLDGSSRVSIVSNNLTNMTTGVLLVADSSTVIYNNNFYNTTNPYSFSDSTVLDYSGNISIDPIYTGAGDYHISNTSPDIGAGLGSLDLFYTDRENNPRSITPDIGAYEVIDGSHGSGPYYVSGSGNDYLNFGTEYGPYRTLDKAMTVADSSVYIDGGHYDSYYLRLKEQNINLNTLYVVSEYKDFLISYTTLTLSDVENKYIPLSTYTLENLDRVAINVVRGPTQVMGTDYTVAKGYLVWDSLTLDGQLGEGDTLRIIHPYEVKAGSTLTLDSHYSAINLGNVLYVSPNGSDSTIFGGDGTHSGGNGTFLLPYRTITKALEDSSAGTNIVVMSGEYGIFNGLEDRVIVPMWDRTGAPDGRWILQSLFETSDYPNHSFSEPAVWDTTAISPSEAVIGGGYLSLVYDGTNAPQANSIFNFTAPFTVQTDLRQALDPIYFGVHNNDNTAVIRYYNGGWDSYITTGAATRHCWGRLDVPTWDTEDFFTDYIYLSSEDIINKGVPLTYFIENPFDVALNIVGGTPQELGTDFYVDGIIKWDGKTLDGELYAGTILRVIYRAVGLSSPASFQINLSDSELSIKGNSQGRWSSLTGRSLISDTTSNPWSAYFYMNESLSGGQVFGRGYASKFSVIAQSISESAVPYTMKTLRQPIVLFNDASGNP